MAMAVKHIQKLPSGRINFRRAFPPELWEVVGRREHKPSLGMEGSPGLLARYEQAAADFDVEVSIAKRKLAGTLDALDAPLIAYLAEVSRVDSLEEDEAARWDPSELVLYKSVRADLALRGINVADKWEGREADRWPTKRQETIDWVLPHYLRLRASGDLEGIVECWREEALDLAEGRGYLIDPNGARFPELCRALNDAAVSALETAQERLDGRLVPTPSQPEPEAPVGRGGPPEALVPLLATFEAYAAVQGISPGVRDEGRSSIKRLIEFVGHDDAAKLTTAGLMEWLLSEPIRKGTLREPRTVRSKYLGPVRAMLTWAVEEKLLPSNAATGIVVRVPKKVKLRERDFTAEEARAILTATLKPPPKRLSAGHALARRWIPWLCAYTGARVNEFSQMRGKDVQEIDGIWTVRITPDAGTVKAKEARVVPIHRHLIEQGFLDAVRVNGPGPLFYDPSKQRVDSDGNRHFKKVGERLAQWVRKEVGIVDPAIQPNHAWRHTFKTLGYSVGMEERVADAIQGHAPKTTGRTYGGPKLKDLARAIAALPSFPLHATMSQQPDHTPHVKT
jgi:integrase